MRSGVSGCGLVLGRSALEILPRWKPRGLGGVYGDCVQAARATVVSADRFAPCGAVFGGAISRLDAFGAAHVASIAARLDRVFNSAHLDRLGAACCRRFERVNVVR